jgi:hypothetical protein
MGQFRKTIVATRMLLLLAMSFATPAAAATFDGQWNVQIASAKPACGGGATVSIGINDGQVASSNPLMTASGRVSGAGNISVTLTSGISAPSDRAASPRHPDQALGEARCARAHGPRSGFNWPLPDESIPRSIPRPLRNIPRR